MERFHKVEHNNWESAMQSAKMQSVYATITLLGTTGSGTSIYFFKALKL